MVYKGVALPCVRALSVVVWLGRLQREGCVEVRYIFSSWLEVVGVALVKAGLGSMCG